MLLILLLPFVLLGLLLGTSPGSRIIVNIAQYFTGDLLRVKKVDGSLLGRLHLEGIELRGDQFRLGIGDFSFELATFRSFSGEGLVVNEFGVRDIELDLPPQNDGPQEQNQKSSIPSDLPLIFPVKILNLDIAGFKVGNADESQEPRMVIFDQLSCGLLVDAKRLALTDFTVQDKNYDIHLNGEVLFETELQIELAGNGRIDDYGFRDTSGSFSVSGPLNNPHLTLHVNSSGDILVDGQVRNLLDSPVWQAHLEASKVNLHEMIRSCPRIPLESVVADIEGDIEGYRGTVSAVGAYDWIDQVRLESQIHADWMGIVFDSLRLVREKGWIETRDAWISWKEFFDWHADLELRDLQLEPIVSALKGQVSGTLTSRGKVGDDGVRADFETLDLQGVVEGYPLKVSGDVWLDDTGVYGRALELTTDEFSGAGLVEVGSYSWEDHSWNLKGKLDDFHPGFVHPVLDGSVNAQFISSGMIGPQAPSGFLDVQHVDGILAGNPLSGGGRLELEDTGTLIADFQLKNGSSDLSIQGSVADNFDLHLNFLGTDLSRYIPEGGGFLQLHGNISGPRAAPDIQAEAQGRDLFFREWRVDTLDVELAPQPEKSTDMAGRVVLSGIQRFGKSLGTAKLELSGTPLSHSLTANWHHPEATLDFQLDDGKFSEKIWEANLENLQISVGKNLEFSQEGSAALHVAGTAFSATELCLQGSVGLFCAKGGLDYEDEIGWQLHGRAEQVDLSLVNQLELMATPITGSFDLTVDLEAQEKSPLTGHIQSSLKDISIDISRYDEKLKNYSMSSGGLDMVFAEDGSRVELRLKGGEGNLQAHLSTQPLFLDSFDLGNQEIRGDVDIEDIAMAPISELTDQAFDVTGKLLGTVEVQGTLTKPRISGDLKLSDGGITIAELGIILEEIGLEFEGDEEDSQVRLQFSSGEGVLHGAGTVGYDDGGVSVGLHLSGEKFHLVELPEYSLLIDPDIQLDFGDGKLAVSGNLSLPAGEIRPEALSRKVSESDDVDFIDGRPSEIQAGPELDLDLTVIIPDSVKVDGYGLTGVLGGELQLASDSARGIVGTGELELKNGKFSLYGSRLDIERGRVIFSGGPVNNPGVDVLASKEVQGERLQARNIVVGMTINGLAQDLQFKLFSDPYMEDSLILSYLAIGKSAKEQGETRHKLFDPTDISLGLEGETSMPGNMNSTFGRQGYRNLGDDRSDSTSIAVGKKLSRNLEVGYNVNMYNQQGQFRIRYELSRGFYIESTSSTEASSADLLYIFER